MLQIIDVESQGGRWYGRCEWLYDDMVEKT